MAPKGEVIAVNLKKKNFTQVEVIEENFVTPK
jgi:hypothetical protein